MIKKSKGGRGRSRSYGGPEDYKNIRKKVLEMFKDLKFSSTLKYAADKVALFGAGLYDEILDVTIKRIEKEYKDRDFDYDIIRDDLIKEWSISKDEAEDIVYEAIDNDHLDMGDQPIWN